MFSEYRKLCDRDELAIGKLHLWKGEDHWVLNFPTKTTWRLPSKLEYVEHGLDTFVKTYQAMGIVSASFPPLGCGNGNLNWPDVRPLIEQYLTKISIPIYVHNLHVGPEFVPEHKAVRAIPATLDAFLGDLRASIYENKGTFATGDGNQPFHVHLRSDEIGVIRGGRQRERIPMEELTNAWVILREGILSIDKFSDETSRRYKSYLFPMLKSLPYVRSAQIARAGQEGSVKAQALFFVRPAQANKDAYATETQQWLSL